MTGRKLTARVERWPIAGAFRISRGAKTEAEVVVAEVTDGAARGWGEATPYARYGETTRSALDLIESVRGEIESGLSREDLQLALPAGAARNVLDCALWDLEAKVSGTPVWRRAGLEPPRPLTTFYTVSVDTPEAMGRAAALSGRPALKLKLGGEGDLARVAAVRRAARDARLVVDANEALTFAALQALAPALAALGVELIEQPLPAGRDEALEGYQSPVMLCADESLHTRAELEACARRYGCVNVKLDKCGGLTEALSLTTAARARGMAVMAGCMVATSLSMAPAMLFAQDAAFVDLDGALLLARDREPALRATGSVLHPPDAKLWG